MPMSGRRAEWFGSEPRHLRERLSVSCKAR
jgi:hypothetical protein